MFQKVIAKFKVVRIELTTGTRDIGKDSDGVHHYEPCTFYTIFATPVYANNDPTHENYRFWQATPTGEIKLGMLNEDVAKAFELGREYYVEFSAAPVAVPA